MICSKCNTSNADSAVFCKGCGSKLQSEEIQNDVQNKAIPADTAPEASVVEESPATAPACEDTTISNLSVTAEEQPQSQEEPVVAEETLQVQEETTTEEQTAPSKEDSVPAEEPVAPEKTEAPAKKTASESAPKKTKEKVKPAKAPKPSRGIAKWVSLVLVIATLIAGVVMTLYFANDNFKPSETGSEAVLLSADDGTLNVAFEYIPDDLKFGSSDEASAKITLENLSQDTIRDLSLEYTLPMGLKSLDDTVTLNADILGPMSSRAYNITIGRDSAFQRNLTPIIIVIASTAVLVAIFIVMFIIAAKKHKASAMRAVASILAIAILLPSSVVFVDASQKEIGNATLVYDEETGIARSISFEVSSGGDFKLGDSEGGDLAFKSEYQLDQKMLVDITKDEETGDLVLNWNKIEDASNYRIYVSGEYMDFYEVGTSETNSYTTSTPYADELQYYRITAEIGDEVLCSEDIRIAINESGYLYVDNDCDLLSDDVEEAYGTSKTLSDTDGDGLSDYYEIAVTFTDPLAYDSDGGEISDAEKDLDNDGLTNLLESEMESNSLDPDSDGDGLDDNTEVSIFNSSPISQDSDYDGLKDDTEYLIDTDPNSYTEDPEGGYTVTVNDPADNGVSAVINDSGNAMSVVEIKTLGEETTLNNLEYIATPIVSVEVSDTATGSVTVPVTKKKDDGGEIVAAVYNPDDGDFRIISEAVVSEDGSTVTVPLNDEYFIASESDSDNGETVQTKRGIYCAMYIANWHIQFESALTPDREQNYFFDVEFVIDESGSMEDSSKSTPNDPERYRVAAAKAFAEALDANDRAAVVGFNDSARRKIELTSDKAAVTAAIDSIVGDAGGTALYNGLDEALNELIREDIYDETRGRFIIALTDGKDGSDATETYDRIIATCNQYGIPIYTIGLGTDLNVDLLSKLATLTNGAYYHIKSADDLPQAFNSIQSNAFYGEDTDGDGLADKVEDMGLRDGVGNVYNTDSANRFTDDDDLSDGEEAGGVINYEYDENDEPIGYYVILTDPTKGDTDGDGIDDLEEKAIGTLPWSKDTDCDGLEDGEELAVGFNPLKANADGDSFGDAQELQGTVFMAELVQNLATDAYNDPARLLIDVILNSFDYIDPYTYDLNSFDKMSAFLQGGLVGDFGGMLSEAGLMNTHLTSSIYYTLGSIIFGEIGGPVTNIRDAIANVIDGNLVGAGLALAGAIGVKGVKSFEKIVKYLSLAYTAGGKVSGYAGTLEASTISRAPGIYYVLLNVLTFVQDTTGLDLTTDELRESLEDQVESGIFGLTKQNARNWERFLNMGYNDLTPYYAREAVDNYFTIDLDISCEASPVELRNAVRAALSAKAGGDLSENSYRLVRAIDLENSEYMQSAILQHALEDSVNRVAAYSVAAYPDLQKTLTVVFTDAIVSEAAFEVLNNIDDYASENNVNIQFVMYTTVD